MIKKRTICVAAGCLLSSFLATAGELGSTPLSIMGFRPVVSLFGGVAGLSSNNSQTFHGTDDEIFVYNYNGQDTSTTTGFVGVFFGAEHQLSYPGLFIDAGLEYDYFGHGKASGMNSVGIEPGTSTLYQYNYNIQSQQVLAVAKLFATANLSALPSHPFYPYVSVGLGAAFNDASQFNTSTEETGSVNLTPTFKSRSTTDFSYTLGLGVDTNVNQHVRVGVGYRFSDFGNASLSNGAIVFNQYRYPTSFSLSVPNTYANQFIAQITYVA